ncbi:hypothetical protein SUGI_0097090 [Cryptomeria japonica]|nr:hypothetical protein SUGI_0097090 [Cryptomeria japonica]
MMTMSSESEALPGTQSLELKRFNQAIELEKQLHSLIGSKGSSSLNVRDLRLKIREIYENIILEDHEYAEGHEIEQALWRLHYKQIEEFRTRIRISVAATTSGPTIPMPGAKHVIKNEPVHKVLASFRSFLSEATGFYHEFMLKLRARHGLSQDFFSNEEVPCMNNQKTAADLKRCQLSCHRCFIYLGDLARYKELHGDGDSQNHDWSIAAGYYLKAVSIWPASGNPHNQLAVLATYVGDELLALYRYFRSLAVELPFGTARDNLILLFEKNQLHYFQLYACANESNSQAPKVCESSKTKGDKTLSIGDGLKLTIKDQRHLGIGDNVGSISDLRKSFRVCFVRLNGILFTKISLETFPEVYAATIHDLEQLLALDDTCLEAGLGSELRSGIGTGSSGAAGVLQLVCILIFTVHNANGSNSVQQPTYAEILQRSELLQNALTIAFECAGRLMRRCADANDVSSSPFLPAMLIFMEWLACRKEITISSEEDEKQANARYFFWKQCIELLNKLLGGKDLNAGATFSSVDNPQIIIEGDVTLWEDFELQGFVPLLPVQRELDYSITPTRVGLRDKKEQQVRVHRLLAAGKTIGTAFSGSGRGITYDKETGKFYLAGKMNDNNTSVNGQIIAKEVAESDQGISEVPNIGYVGGFKENKVAMTDALPQSVNGDEDDEEYIVFKPVPKDVSAMNTMRISADKESGEVSFNVPNVSVTYTSTAFQGDGVAINHAASLGQAVTGIGSAASSTVHSLVGTTVSSVIPSRGNVSPVCQGGLQLNKQNSIGGPLSALPSLTLSSWGIQNHDVMLKGGLGNSKVNSPGIIGQQKHIDMSLSYWNTQIDVPSLAGLSDLSINDLVSSQAACEKYGMSSNFTGLNSQHDRNQLSGIPSSICTDSPFSVARPHPSAPLLPEENNINSSPDISTGMQYMNQSGNVSIEAKGINSAFTMQLECSDLGKSSLKTFRPSGQPVAKENPGRSWMGPSAIGPPPGFGSTRFMSGQSDEDAEAPLQVDDYAWLDGYTSSGIHGMNSEKYGNWGLPMYSSDNGIWTSSDKSPVSPDSTGFPFPGIGLSGFCHADDQPQKQTLDLQFYEQLLHDQQSKWFDYSMEAKPLQFGTLQSLYEAQQQSESQKQLLLLQKQQEWYRQYHMGGPFAS